MPTLSEMSLASSDLDVHPGSVVSSWVSHQWRNFGGRFHCFKKMALTEVHTRVPQP